MLTEHDALAERMNDSWSKYSRSKRAIKRKQLSPATPVTGEFVLVLHETSKRWRDIRAAGDEKEFLCGLTCDVWDWDTDKPMDKWGRMLRFAALPTVVKYADRQAWRGWSVWREVSKTIKTAGADYVEAKFASGEWGPDLRREMLDNLTGNALRHRPKK
jgi:hypothetical protein